MSTPQPERWLLRCPVDGALIGPGVAECSDCGLSVGPLRALASTAAAHLEMAALVEPRLAVDQVEAAVALVPESENFLLDAGRALAAAGALEAARGALERAALIAPGRKDVSAELARVSGQISPTAWLAEGVSSGSASSSLEERPAQVPAPQTAGTPRDELMAEHARARRQRDAAALDSADYRDGCLAVARLEIAISALSVGAS